ncbi:hypothetical protein BDZ97DRAFT_1822827, partial [Flammula alnicola]
MLLLWPMRITSTTRMPSTMPLTTPSTTVMAMAMLPTTTGRRSLSNLLARDACCCSRPALPGGMFNMGNGSISRRVLGELSARRSRSCSLVCRRGHSKPSQAGAAQPQQQERRQYRHQVLNLRLSHKPRLLLAPRVFLTSIWHPTLCGCSRNSQTCSEVVLLVTNNLNAPSERGRCRLLLGRRCASGSSGASARR